MWTLDCVAHMYILHSSSACEYVYAWGGRPFRDGFNENPWELVVEDGSRAGRLFVGQLGKGAPSIVRGNQKVIVSYHLRVKLGVGRGIESNKLRGH